MYKIHLVGLLVLSTIVDKIHREGLFDLVGLLVLSTIVACSFAYSFVLGSWIKPIIYKLRQRFEERSITPRPIIYKLRQAERFEERTITLRLSIDKEMDEVLFAESNKDFVEVLLGFLTLPMGEIVRLCGKNTGIPPLENLYASVEALDKQSFRTAASKNMLLRPRSAYGYSSGLAIDLDQKEPSLYYICSHTGCRDHHGFRLVSTVKGSECICKGAMKKQICVKAMIANNTGGFLKDRGKFIISDDLVVLPVTATNTQRLITREKKSGTATKVREVTIGTKEVLQILKYSMISTRPLTNALLRDNDALVASSVPNRASGPYSASTLPSLRESEGRWKTSARGQQCVPIEKSKGNLLMELIKKKRNLPKARLTGKIIELKYLLMSTRPRTNALLRVNDALGASSVPNRASGPYSASTLPLLRESEGRWKTSARGQQCVPIEKIKGNLLMESSTGKIIGLETREDLADLMFSFLTIPLGSVVKLCGKQDSSLGCLSTLYWSLEELHVDNFKSKSSKNLLLSPKIAPKYGCKSQLLNIEEEKEPRFDPSYRYQYICYECFLEKKHCSHGASESIAIINPKIPGQITGGGRFLKKKTFIITNDLRVEYLQPALHVCQVNPLDVDIIGIDFDEGKALKTLHYLMTSANVLDNALHDVVRMPAYSLDN